jgi:hypothetical protein
VPIPVHIERQNSSDYLQTKQSSAFNQFAWSTQQQIDSMQHQTLSRIQAHQQSIEDQHMNMFMQIPPLLTAPTLIVNHPPVTRTATSYSRQEQVVYQPTYMYPS